MKVDGVVALLVEVTRVARQGKFDGEMLDADPRRGGIEDENLRRPRGVDVHRKGALDFDGRSLDGGDARVKIHASVADVEQLLWAAGDLPWEQAKAVGEEEEYRAEPQRGDQAMALLFDKAVVHGSVVAAV